MPLDPAHQTEDKIVPLPVSHRPREAPAQPGAAFRGLLWFEWYLHGKLLLFFLAAWLAAAWTLPLYANPAYILIFAAVFAVVAGPVYGGNDTSEGTEEFTFALPPTRAERYLARLAVSGCALLLFTAMDLLALGLDLPQILAKLYVESGLIHPRPIFRSGLLYGLVVVLPLMIFGTGFALSAMARTRTFLLSTPLWSVLIALIVLRSCFWYEELVWGKLNGWFSCPVLAVLSITVLWAGFHAYRRKEIGPTALPLAIPPLWWLWSFLAAVAFALVLTLAASLARHYLRTLAGG